MEPSVIDPYPQPTYSLLNRAMRAGWGVVWLTLFRPTPRPLHRWRVSVLRLFGARIGPNCAVYPGVKIWAPWNLECEDTVAIAEGVEIYNPARLRLGSHAIVSQGAYLCGATHDMNSREFPLIAKENALGAYSWVCARATVMPGVNLGEGAVLALGGVATRDIPDWEVHAGVPAKRISFRSKR